MQKCVQKGQLYEPIGFGLLTLLAAKQMDPAGDSAALWRRLKCSSGINGFFMCCWFLFKNFSGIIPIVALIIGAHGSIKDDEERARRNFIEYWKNYK